MKGWLELVKKNTGNPENGIQAICNDLMYFG